MRAPTTGRTIVVFDIDGTISDDQRRADLYAPWLHSGEPDANLRWEAYYAAARDDEPLWPAFTMAYALGQAGFTIMCATGRPERYRDMTLDWLRRTGFAVADTERLLMRPEGNRASNATLKATQARQIGPPRIALWVDDHPAVPGVLAELGVPVLGLHNPAWAHPEDVIGASR